MNDILIRPATLADAEGIADVFLDELSHHVDLMPDRFRIPDPILPDGWLEEQLSRETMRMFLAMKDRVIAGLILVRIDESRGDLSVPRTFVYINEVGVLKAYRGQGIGQALMRYVEEWAAECGISELELNVWECNAGALRFYERLGYEVVSRRMIKKIAS